MPERLGMRNTLFTSIALAVLLLGSCLPANAQTDSLRLIKQPDSLNAPIQRPLAGLKPQSHTLSLPTKRKFQAPIYVEGNRLKFHLRIPLRKGIKFTFPKIIYAGKTPPYDPKIAWQRSAIIPGWGQYYNRAFWKTPFIYGGYGFTGFLIFSTHQNYKDFQRAYRIRIQRDVLMEPVSEVDSFFMTTQSIFETSAPDRLQDRRDLLRRNRDYYILLTIGYHLIWVLEAYIHAHLRDLDFSEDLTLRVTPGILRDPLGVSSNGFMPGAKVTITF